MQPGSERRGSRLCQWQRWNGVDFHVFRFLAFHPKHFLTAPLPIGPADCHQGWKLFGSYLFVLPSQLCRGRAGPSVRQVVPPPPRFSNPTSAATSRCCSSLSYTARAEVFKALTQSCHQGLSVVTQTEVFNWENLIQRRHNRPTDIQREYFVKYREFLSYPCHVNIYVKSCLAAEVFWFKCNCIFVIWSNLSLLHMTNLQWMQPCCYLRCFGAISILSHFTHFYVEQKWQVSCMILLLQVYDELMPMPLLSTSVAGVCHLITSDGSCVPSDNF